MIQLTLQVKLVAYVAGILGRKIDNPLYKRMSANITPDTVVTDMVGVSLTESELQSIMSDLTVAPEGVSGLLNTELQDAVAAQVIAGITAEGPGEEEVLDDQGNPQTVIDTLAGNPVTLTRPKKWARVAGSLGALTATNQYRRKVLIEQGLQYLKA